MQNFMTNFSEKCPGPFHTSLFSGAEMESLGLPGQCSTHRVNRTTQVDSYSLISTQSSTADRSHDDYRPVNCQPDFYAIS